MKSKVLKYEKKELKNMQDLKNDAQKVVNTAEKLIKKQKFEMRMQKKHRKK